MAAGVFLYENKIRPGMYSQINGRAKISGTLSERGTCALLLNTNSGALISEISANDILNDKVGKYGLTLADITDDANVYNYVYPYCNKVIVARLNYGGQKATVTAGGLVATAKHYGLGGNKLSFSVVANGSAFIVKTFLDNVEVVSRKCASIADVRSNDYIDFTPETESSELQAVAATSLAGGTNAADDSAFQKCIKALSEYDWNCAALCSLENKELFVNWIKSMREDRGKWRQGVIGIEDKEPECDYEGIIQVHQKFIIKDGAVNVDDLEDDGSDYNEVPDINLYMSVAFAAAITAGAEINVSNTYHTLPSQVSNVYPSFTLDDEFEALLQNGVFAFSRSSRGALVVEKDINSLHTFTQSRTKPFSKNGVIRVLDEITNTKQFYWETVFCGKIRNDANGRMLWKSQVIEILSTCVQMAAINPFASEDIVVELGDTVDSIRSYEIISPTDALEIVYNYVTVLG